MNKDKYYKTSAFYLTVFLIAKSIPLCDIERSDHEKLVFVFLNSKKLQDLIRSYNFHEDKDPALKVNFRKTEKAIKTLKSLIHD